MLEYPVVKVMKVFYLHFHMVLLDANIIFLNVHFEAVFCFLYSLKETSGFLTFLGFIEMEQWSKKG